MGIQRKLFWHYTTMRHFEKIAECREIRPTMVLIEQREKPSVWFGDLQDWEPTASKIARSYAAEEVLDHRAMFRKEIIAVRIGVSRDCLPFGWAAFNNLSGISHNAARHLADTGRREGSGPEHWRVSFSAVPAQKWTVVQLWDGDT